MGKQERRRQKKDRRAAKKAEETASALPVPVDRRALSVNVEAMDGVPVSEPHVAVVVEPVRLASQEAFYFQSPFLIPFYLLKSKALRDAAEPRREAAVTETITTTDGSLRPRDPRGALEDLALATILALAAVEAYANDAIGRLPDDALVEVPTRVGGETVAVMRDKSAMIWFRLGEKLDRAVPVLTSRGTIKGTEAWRRYRNLARIRNGLLHPERKAINDPDKPGPFGRLMRGDGSKAPEDAAFIIEALEPEWIPEGYRADLGLPPKSTTS